jgi:amino acid transporter
MKSRFTHSWRQTLGLWDAVSLVFGIVVGAAIFRAPTTVFAASGGIWQALVLWLAGGVLSLLGAFCYSELASTYPRSGGDYHYLTRAFGRWTGFQFAWTQLTAVFTGSIGAMAYTFADYARPMLDWPESANCWLAAAPIALLSVTNILGLIVGKTTQNVLTVSKFAGLAAVVVAGMASFDQRRITAAATGAGTDFGLALVFVLYAYGGWSHAAFVTSEVRDPQRNVPRALIFGISGIALLYLLVNAAYAIALGDRAASSESPAAETMRAVWGAPGERAVGLLVICSALGAINGMILTGARVYAALGADYPLLGWMGNWNAGRTAPVSSLIAQGGIALLMVFAVGTPAGRIALDSGLALFTGAAIPWERYHGGFDVLVAASAPMYWTFLLLTSLALFVLRWKDRELERPFRTPLYPIAPALFCASCGYMLYASLSYAGALALLGVVLVLTGSVIYAVGR